MDIRKDIVISKFRKFLENLKILPSLDQFGNFEPFLGIFFYLFTDYLLFLVCVPNLMLKYYHFAHFTGLQRVKNDPCPNRVKNPKYHGFLLKLKELF